VLNGIDLEDRDLPSISLSIATALGMPKLASLPPTILPTVKSGSLDSPLWYYSAIKDLAEKLSFTARQNESTQCQVYKLNEIEAWEDGKPPTISDSAPDSRIIRVAIDRHGIRRIESLPARPEYEPWRSNSLAYVFIDSTQAKKSCILLKVGIHISLKHSLVSLIHL
jgi:hypothetical protein